MQRNHQSTIYVLFAALCVVLVSQSITAVGHADTGEAAGAVVSTVFGEILPGTAARVNASDTKGMQHITITVTEPARNVKVRVTPQEEPNNAASLTARERLHVYRFMDITADNLNVSVINTSTIGFTVSPDWVEHHGINTSTVRLYRYQAGWNTLETRPANHSEAVYAFTAVTPGFSSFAIAGIGDKKEDDTNAVDVEDNGELGEQVRDSRTDTRQPFGGLPEEAGYLLTALLIAIGAGAVYWWKEHGKTAAVAEKPPRQQELEQRLDAARERLQEDAGQEAAGYDREHIWQELETAQQHIDHEAYDAADEVLTDVEQFLR